MALCCGRRSAAQRANQQAEVYADPHSHFNAIVASPPAMAVGEALARARRTLASSHAAAGGEGHAPAPVSDDDAIGLIYSARGPVGEVAAHTAMLYHRTDVALALVRLRPAMLWRRYGYVEGAPGETSAPSPYQGENLLHIAIANGDFEAVVKLVTMEEEVRRSHVPHHSRDAAGRLVDDDCYLIDAEATGSFFAIDRPTYYGGLPLSFAVAMNDARAATYLVMRAGACLVAPDRYGNTPLHIAVHHGRVEMIALLFDLWARGYGRPDAAGEGGHGSRVPSLARFVNAEGCTPLAYAAKLDDCALVSLLIARESEPHWRWGPVTSEHVSLHHIDPAIRNIVDAERAKAAAEGGETAVVAAKQRALDTTYYEAVRTGLEGEMGPYVVRPTTHRVATVLEMVCQYDAEQVAGA